MTEINESAKSLRSEGVIQTEDISPSEVTEILKRLDHEYILSLFSSIENSKLSDEDKKNSFSELNLLSVPELGFKVSDYKSLFPDRPIEIEKIKKYFFIDEIPVDGLDVGQKIHKVSDDKIFVSGYKSKGLNATGKLIELRRQDNTWYPVETVFSDDGEITDFHIFSKDEIFLNKYDKIVKITADGTVPLGHHTFGDRCTIKAVLALDENTVITGRGVICLWQKKKDSDKWTAKPLACHTGLFKMKKYPYEKNFYSMSEQGSIAKWWFSDEGKFVGGGPMAEFKEVWNDFDVLYDGRIVVAGNNFFRVLKPNGQQIVRKETPNFRAQKIQALSKNSFLMGGPDYSTTIWEETNGIWHESESASQLKNLQFVGDVRAFEDGKIIAWDTNEKSLKIFGNK